MNRQKFSANRVDSCKVGSICYLSLETMVKNIPKEYMPNVGWSNEARIEERIGSRFLVNAIDTFYEQSFWVDKDDITLAKI